MIVESDGLKWIVDEDGVDGRLGPTNHEAELAPHFACTGNFLDIGGDVGRWSLRVAATAAHVYALEPHHGRARRMIANMELNGVKNMTVFPWGAWETFDSGVIGATGQVGEGNQPAMLAPIDNMVAFSSLELVKIDIEGFEYEALSGMAGTIGAHHPRLLIEVHERIRPGSWAPAESLLHGWGYTITPLASLGGQDYVMCEAN